MLFFQEKTVIFGIGKIFFQQPVDHFKKILHLGMGQGRHQPFHQLIIRKFLEVVNHRVFVCLPVQSEADQPGICFNKIMGMLFHGRPLPYVSKNVVCHCNGKEDEGQPAHSAIE